MTALSYRLAAIGDAADIHMLMLTLAADIPLAVETLEQEEALYAALRKILAFGQSWVGLDGETIIGFVLVDSAEVGRHWGENELLNLRYAAVAPAFRDDDVLDALVRKVLERAVPITASVRDTNRGGLADCLMNLGFSEVENRVGQRRFRHDP
jgi:predicted N-acetyltransferase YhbS